MYTITITKAIVQLSTLCMSTENKTYNWMIYVYSDVKDINKNKSKYTAEEEVDEFEAEFINKSENEQVKMTFGLNQFRLDEINYVVYHSNSC